MAFFHSQPTSNDPTETDIQRAKQLRLALQKHNATMGKYTGLKSWGVQFAKLKRMANDERITIALDWYISHIGEAFVPKAHSASGFRKKFQSIEEAMFREQGVATEEKQKRELVISDKAKSISQARGMLWPKGEKEHELAFIQLSINNYTSFRQRLIDLRNSMEGKGPASDRHWRLLNYLLTREPHVGLFVENWLLRVHHIAWHWPNWKGNLLKWAWKPDAKMYQPMIESHVRDYCGDVTRWKMIREMLDVSHAHKE